MGGKTRGYVSRRWWARICTISLYNCMYSWLVGGLDTRIRRQGVLKMAGGIIPKLVSISHALHRNLDHVPSARLSRLVSRNTRTNFGTFDIDFCTTNPTHHCMVMMITFAAYSASISQCFVFKLSAAYEEAFLFAKSPFFVCGEQASAVDKSVEPFSASSLYND